MRAVFFILLAAVAGGCQSMHQTQPSASTEAPIERTYRDASSAALVFDPPVSVDEPQLDLARDSRTPSAFLGYDEAVVSSYFLRIDDRQDDFWGDRHERRAVISESRVRYR